MFDLSPHNEVGDELAPGRPVSPSLAKESLIIFDWDDTILPTSWLDRIQALTSSEPPRPEVQRQLSNLCKVCAETISMATKLGKVILITNSAPGWVDQSCQLFMPELFHKVRNFQIFAKPWSAPLTFKTGAFRRESRDFGNLVSVGDGDAERDASLRLQALQGLSNQKSMTGGDSEEVLPGRIKSVKLAELPTCQQLISQHEMLHSRLADVVAYEGSLDLKSRFANSGLSISPVPLVPSCKSMACQLVHLNRPVKEAPPESEVTQPKQTPRKDTQPKQTPRKMSAAAARPALVVEDGGTEASSKMQALLASRAVGGSPGSRERQGQLPGQLGQLPPPQKKRACMYWCSCHAGHWCRHQHEGVKALTERC
jgi:hypothetical protein